MCESMALTDATKKISAEMQEKIRRDAERCIECDRKLREIDEEEIH